MKCIHIPNMYVQFDTYIILYILPKHGISHAFCELHISIVI